MARKRIQAADDIEDETPPPTRRIANGDEFGTPAENDELDDMFASMAGVVAEQTGHNHILTVSETDNCIVGIPLPSLSLAYLFSTNIWRLGRCVELYGKEGSCKSSFLFEIMRWICVYRGLAVHLENENKDASPLLRSILADPRFAAKRVRPHPTNTLEEWQRGLSFWMDQAELKALGKGKNDPGVGFVTPYVFGVDSLTATMSEGTREKTRNDGAAARGFPEMALLISTYMKDIPARLRDRPWSLVATNHLKMGQDHMGRPQENVPGGMSFKFYASLRVRMDRIKDVDAAAYGGVRIKYTCTKNSIGPGKRTIQAEMKWLNVVGEDGVVRQHTYWDWDQATIDMLIDRQTTKSVWKQINEIVDLNPTSGRRIWSEALGIPKAKPVKYGIAGQMLEQRPDLLQALYPVLMISRYPFFVPGVDWTEYVNGTAERVDDPATRLYRSGVNHEAFEEVTEELSKAQERKSGSSSYDDD